jgi:galactokinase
MADPAPERFVARAPGRVNLIGEHTDYTGGLVLPMAIDRGTTIEGVRTPGGDTVALASADEPGAVRIALPVANPAAVEPAWGRYVAGVAAELGPRAAAVDGRVTTDLPIGAGLSSSAALEVAASLAMHPGPMPALERARLCQRAEHRATGVPCGIMDQLASCAGVAGHALLVDCHSLAIEPVPFPDDLQVVVRFVARRALAGSAYADRVAQCAAAEREIGPLRLADPATAAGVTDPVARRRARHVAGENARVRDFVAALRAGDAPSLGALLLATHASLRDDFEVSTPAMDAAVDAAVREPGVLGARLMGGGFGGCIVVLARADARLDGWRVRPSPGASLS